MKVCKHPISELKLLSRTNAFDAGKHYNILVCLECAVMHRGYDYPGSKKIKTTRQSPVTNTDIEMYKIVLNKGA